MWRPIWSSTALILVGLFPLCMCEFPPPNSSYKILMLLPMSSKSHGNVFLPLAEALADRGHEVTVIENIAMNSRHPRVHEILHNLTYLEPRYSLQEVLDDMSVILNNLDAVLPRLARDFYRVPKVTQVYRRRQEFDVVIIDLILNEVAFPFAHKKPFIMLSPPGLVSSTSAMQGNVLNPAYSFSLTSSSRSSMTIVERLRNLVSHFTEFSMYNFKVLPKIQAEISEQFPDLPSLMDIKKNVSLTLLNSDHAYDTSVPLLPSQVEVGGIHCRPANQLPKDLSAWIEGSGSEGVIYFSLGSLATSSSIPQKYLDIFLTAFAQLPQRVIWKFEDDHLPGISDNILLRKWLPQQDLLAQKKVKVFVTHGGLLSTQEALYHGTPMLALPIFGDQPRNCDMISAKGYGLCLAWKDLTVDRFVSALKEVIEDKTYSQRVDKTSQVFRDKMEGPLDRAVWWTEYVIRHQGAPAMKCPGSDLTWYEYFLIDVLVLLHLSIFIIMWLMIRCKRLVSAALWSAKKKKQE